MTSMMHHHQRVINKINPKAGTALKWIDCNDVTTATSTYDWLCRAFAWVESEQGGRFLGCH